MRRGGRLSLLLLYTSMAFLDRRADIPENALIFGCGVAYLRKTKPEVRNASNVKVVSKKPTCEKL
jgi:hypothetical protein